MNSYLEKADLDFLILENMSQHQVINDNGVGSFFINASYSQMDVFFLPGCFIWEETWELLIELENRTRHSTILHWKFYKQRVIQYPTRTTNFSSSFKLITSKNPDFDIGFR